MDGRRNGVEKDFSKSVDKCNQLCYIVFTTVTKIQKKEDGKWKNLILRPPNGTSWNACGSAPQTGRELTEQLEASMGWSRSTTLTLLRRMVGKGVVTCDTEGTKNTFSPAVRREDAALAETETFLDRVYQGSLSMMVSAMTRRQAISKEEIDELYELLRQMEEGTK